MKVNLYAEHISYDWFRSKTSFDTEAKGIWEMVHYIALYITFFCICSRCLPSIIQCRGLGREGPKQEMLL